MHEIYKFTSFPCTVWWASQTPEAGSHCDLRYRVLLLSPHSWLLWTVLPPPAAPTSGCWFLPLGSVCFWLWRQCSSVLLHVCYLWTGAVQTTLTRSAMGLITCVFNGMLGVTLGIRCPLNKNSRKCLNSVFLNYFIRRLKGKVISILQFIPGSVTSRKGSEVHSCLFLLSPQASWGT